MLHIISPNRILVPFPKRPDESFPTLRRGPLSAFGVVEPLPLSQALGTIRFRTEAKEYRQRSGKIQTSRFPLANRQLFSSPAAERSPQCDWRPSGVHPTVTLLSQSEYMKGTSARRLKDKPTEVPLRTEEYRETPEWRPAI